MIRLGGHLGDTVSALVDGQLDPAEEERAWAHVLRCPACRRLVEHEGWTKRRLSGAAGGEPSAQLLGSLYDLHAGHTDAARVEASWAEATRLEQHGRGRRRAGIAAVGVGSVSAAVLGLSTLSGAPLGIGNAPTGSPASSFTGRPSPAPASTPVSPRSSTSPRFPLLRRDPLPEGVPGAVGRRSLPVPSPR